MLRIICTLLMVLVITCSYGQYWFGPKIGVNYVDPIYQDRAFEDSYLVDDDFDFHIGVAFNYTASDLYSVYAEMVYEHMNRDLIRFSDNGANVLAYSNAENNFITVPVMLRVSLGNVPFHYYVNGGPKISYWVSSKGSLWVPTFAELAPDPLTGEEIGLLPQDYSVTFNSGRDNSDDVRLLSNPNRIQFGLAVGGGAYFDLVSGARLMVDFRYSFGHSNLGFDDEDDEWFVYDDDDYVESFEYSMNTASLALSYMFEYNSQMKRKGKSTSRQSNKKKK